MDVFLRPCKCNICRGEGFSLYRLPEKVPKLCRMVEPALWCGIIRLKGFTTVCEVKIMKLSGAQAIVKALELEGVEVIFGYPGLPFVRSMMHYRNRIYGIF